MASAAYGFATGLVGLPSVQAQLMPRAYDTGAISPAQVVNATTSEQTFTVTGLTTSDAVFVVKPTHQAGLGIVNARVSAADTLAITFMNATAATITPTASETYKVIAFRVA